MQLCLTTVKSRHTGEDWPHFRMPRQVLFLINHSFQKERNVVSGVIQLLIRSHGFKLLFAFLHTISGPRRSWQGNDPFLVINIVKAHR